MGDRRRFHEVAELILRQFPPARFPVVADVAGGKGKLAGKLQARGYRTTIIDTRRSRKHPKGAKRVSQPYVAGMARKFDVLVGLHPDGATEQLALSARRRPVVLIPCCLHRWDGPEDGRIEQRIRTLWGRIGVSWIETQLSIMGRSLVLVGQPSRSDDG